MQRSWLRNATWVVLFAVAFGYVEASVVAYLRLVYDPIRESLQPGGPATGLLPLITLDQLRQADERLVRYLGVEIGREFATIVMLATVAALAARRKGDWLAQFMLAFGVWDIAYYIGLKGMIGFPASLLTWDILFLIPVPWLGPVLAPVLVAATMIAAGLILLARERPLVVGWAHWIVVVAGALTIIWSFCKDYARTTAGEMPHAFDWILFFVGLSVSMLAFVHALRRNGSPRPPSRQVR